MAGPKTKSKQRNLGASAKTSPTEKKKKKTASGVPIAALMEGGPDKSHFVAAAIAGQLTAEHRWPPNDITKVMGADYRYDQMTMGNFLRQVQAHLASNYPSLQFKFDGPFVFKALQSQVGSLMIAVNANTI